MLRIAGTEVNIDHSAFEVYVTGCTRGCLGCHNPELQGFGGGMKWTHWYRQNQGKLKDLPLMNVWILGGDLLCQYDESDVVEFLKYLRRTVPEGTKLWLWTGGEFSEVRAWDAARHQTVRAAGRVAYKQHHHKPAGHGKRACRSPRPPRQIL